ncbi:hypothetical protein [Halorubrum yunnanense]|uniref:Uncharacterized protein n=1 Tax=Halorubrum yunnanense TaxID=1526162 RepID=A0ABD5Y9R2_9EURY|nr:hypothetical protein [Halorubrum yunnanense]
MDIGSQEAVLEAHVDGLEETLPTEELGPAPDVVIEGFHDLADRLE